MGLDSSNPILDLVSGVPKKKGLDCISDEPVRRVESKKRGCITL